MRTGIAPRPAAASPPDGGPPAAGRHGHRVGPRAGAHRRRVGALPQRHGGHHDHRRDQGRQQRRRAEHPARRRRQPGGRAGQPAAPVGARPAARRPGHRRPQLRHDHRAARARGRRGGGGVLDPARRLRRHPRLPARQDQRRVPGDEGDRRATAHGRRRARPPRDRRGGVRPRAHGVDRRGRGPHRAHDQPLRRDQPRRLRDADRGHRRCAGVPRGAHARRALGRQLPRGRPDDLRRLGARVRAPAPRPAAGRPVTHPPPAGVPRRDGREAALGRHVDQPLGAGCAARRRPAVRRDRLGLGPARLRPRGGRHREGRHRVRHHPDGGRGEQQPRRRRARRLRGRAGVRRPEGRGPGRRGRGGGAPGRAPPAGAVHRDHVPLRGRRPQRRERRRPRRPGHDAPARAGFPAGHAGHHREHRRVGRLLHRPPTRTRPSSSPCTSAGSTRKRSTRACRPGTCRWCWAGTSTARWRPHPTPPPPRRHRPRSPRRSPRAACPASTNAGASAPSRRAGSGWCPRRSA